MTSRCKIGKGIYQSVTAYKFKNKKSQDRRSDMKVRLNGSGGSHKGRYVKLQEEKFDALLCIHDNSLYKVRFYIKPC
jgi:hypothetical protein